MNEQFLTDRIKAIIKEELHSVLDDIRYRLDEMARVSKFSDNFDIVVLTDDHGYVPHVHIIDLPTRGREFDCCVQLGTNRYFQHGEHQDTMNTKMRKAFNKLMREPHRNVHYRNVYEYAVNLWNDNNSNSYVQIEEDDEGNVIVPDYTNILPYK